MSKLSFVDVFVIVVVSSTVLFFAIYVLVDVIHQNRLAKEGVPAAAKILAVRNTGSTVNYNPELRIKAEITRNDGVPSYVTEFSEVVPTARLASVQVGATLAARVLPDKPDAVGLAWPN